MMDADLRNLLGALLLAKGKPVPGKPELAADVRAWAEAHDKTVTTARDGQWLMYTLR